MRHPTNIDTMGMRDSDTLPSHPRIKKRRIGDVSQLWGCLIPWNVADPHIPSVELSKAKRKYIIGSSPQSDVYIPDADIDETHCVIEWDGCEANVHYAVMVTSFSATGIFINGKAVCEGGNRCAVLRDGSEIQFGSKVGGPRYIYRQVDNFADPLRGLHKHYELFNVVGQGSFSTVVKVLHKQQGKWYAMKMIPVHSLQRGLAEGEVGVRTTRSNIVLREVEILEQLHHPNICQLKEVFLECGRLNLVLELVENGSLAAYLDEVGVMFEHQAKAITYQICDALAYMHKLGVVHRDLKPENLLLASRFPLKIKVSDFGLAKHIDTLRNLRTACGTRAYAAPEVIDPGSRGHYDEKVDSWSIGVVVFKMLTSCFPFSERYLNGDFRKKMTRRDAQVSWLLLPDYNVTDVGQKFIRVLLEYEPRKRMALTEALEHSWLAGQTPASDPPEREDYLRSSRSLVPAPLECRRVTPDAVGHKTKATKMGIQRKAPIVTEDKDSTDDLINSMSSMSISDLPIASRTRGKQKAAVVPIASSESVPGLGQLRRSTRIAGLRAREASRNG
ncbi:kinase-like protein [Dichomitus squalens]|uniref:Kinase-like protein n=1 Tax=Dichomitus squalens TaxID=114155 RepID=A0A4Q9M9J5_9APHY|nr:kinase-like protein [Dichomitus squalens]